MGFGFWDLLRASRSSARGAGSGLFRSGTQLNNMLGELDVIGPHEKEPGERLASMMTPTLVLDAGRPRLVIGSAGSVRLAGAIAQVTRQVAMQVGKGAERAFTSTPVLAGLLAGFAVMYVTGMLVG